jgi:hypothetical protein
VHLFRLAKLSKDFERDFSDSSVPSLPQILSTISISASKQSDFFTSVVRSKDLIPLYHDVVLWMLKRDMLITLHLRIRVVATQELKMRVRLARERARTKRAKASGRSNRRTTELKSRQSRPEDSPEITSPGTTWVSFSPKSARKYTRRMQSRHSGDSELSELVLKESDDEGAGDDREETDAGNNDEDEDAEDDKGDEDDEGDEEEEWEEQRDEYVNWDNRENNLLPTMINDPGRATPLQRRWLSAMSEGKDALVAKRFEQ